MRLRACVSFLILTALSSTGVAQLPGHADSFRFAVVGNSGTGDQSQYELAEQMAALRERFKYDDVLLLGGNIHGSDRPRDFVKKFEAPYKRLLEGGVTFHAALGDEDSRDQRYYKNFNMNGNSHYAFEPRPDVQFLALDSSDVTEEQIAWLESKLRDSKSAWKVVYMHHPVYSSGHRRGSGPALRERLEPLFLKYNVSAVLSADDHVYARITPQNGITYFVVGSGGKVQRGGIDRNSAFTASGFDADLAFMVAEITGDRMHFRAMSRTGQTVDSGVLARRK